MAYGIELGNTPMLADNLATSSYVHAFTGDYDGATEYSQEAFRISQSIQNAWGCSYSQAFVGPVYWQQGNPDLAVETMRSSLRYAEQSGIVVSLVYTRSELGLVLGELGDLVQGLAAVREAIRIAENGRPQLLRYALSQLARLQLLAGDTEAAAAAVAELREHSGPFHMIQPYVIAVAECQLALQQGDAAEAGRLLAQRLADLRRYGMKAYIPETLHLLAQAQQQAGQESDAVASLDEARELAAAIGSRWMEWRILAALASLSSPAEAKELRGRARAIIDGIEQHISDPALRAVVPQSAGHTQPGARLIRRGTNAALVPLTCLPAILDQDGNLNHLPAAHDADRYGLADAVAAELGQQVIVVTHRTRRPRPRWCRPGTALPSRPGCPARPRRSAGRSPGPVALPGWRADGRAGY